MRSRSGCDRIDPCRGSRMLRPVKALRMWLVALFVASPTLTPIAYAAADEPRDGLRVGSGAIAPSPALVFDDERLDIQGLGGARLMVSGSVERAHTFTPRQWSGWVDGDLFTMFMGDERSRLVAVGASAVARYMHWPSLGVGAGLSFGYLFDFTAEVERGALRESAFFGLVAVPAAFSFDPFDLQVLVPVWFAETTVAGIEAFRPAMVAALFSVTARGTVRR